MTAEEYLKKHRIYDDETIYNSVDEMTGTLTQLMESYHKESSKELVEALGKIGSNSGESYIIRIAIKALENHLK